VSTSRLVFAWIFFSNCSFSNGSFRLTALLILQFFRICFDLQIFELRFLRSTIF